MSRNILVIEDNKEIAGLISMHLKDINCEVNLVHDGLDGWLMADKNTYDLIILDLMLPRLDGIEICQKIRAKKNYTPILMLTAKSSEVDRVIGLEVGADDYLPKPFSVRELVARVKALFRRVEAFSTKEQQVDTELNYDDLSINTDKRTATVGERVLDLTAKEFDLLIFFASSPGHVYSRTTLLDQVWGYGHEGYEHTVNSHINRLRAKLEDNPAKPKFLLTVWGVGYKFNPDLIKS